MIYGKQAVTGVVMLREVAGIQTVFNLLREAIEGNIGSEEDHQLDWLLVGLLLKLIYVMNFNEST